MISNMETNSLLGAEQECGDGGGGEGGGAQEEEEDHLASTIYDGAVQTIVIDPHGLTME